jgi:hypothetical protein
LNIFCALYKFANDTNGTLTPEELAAVNELLHEIEEKIREEELEIKSANTSEAEAR